MNGSDRKSLCGQDLYLFSSPVYRMLHGGCLTQRKHSTHERLESQQFTSILRLKSQRSEWKLQAVFLIFPSQLTREDNKEKPISALLTPHPLASPLRNIYSWQIRFKLFDPIFWKLTLPFKFCFQI